MPVTDLFQHCDVSKMINPTPQWLSTRGLIYNAWLSNAVRDHALGCSCFRNLASLGFLNPHARSLTYTKYLIIVSYNFMASWLSHFSLLSLGSNHIMRPELPLILHNLNFQLATQIFFIQKELIGGICMDRLMLWLQKADVLSSRYFA